MRIGLSMWIKEKLDQLPETFTAEDVLPMLPQKYIKDNRGKSDRMAVNNALGVLFKEGVVQRRSMGVYCRMPKPQGVKKCSPPGRFEVIGRLEDVDYDTGTVTFRNVKSVNVILPQR